MGALDFGSFAYGATRGQDDDAAQKDLRRSNQQTYDIRQQALDEAKTSAPMRQQQTQQALDTGKLQNDAARLNLQGATDNQSNLQFKNGVQNELQNFVGSGGQDATAVARLFDMAAKKGGRNMQHQATAGKDPDGKNFIEVTDNTGSKIRFADNTPNPIIGAGADKMSAQEQVMLFGEYMADPQQFSKRQQGQRDLQTQHAIKVNDKTTEFLQQLTLEQVKSGNRTSEHMAQVKGNIERALRSDPIFSTLKPEEQQKQRDQIYGQVFGDQAAAGAAQPGGAARSTSAPNGKVSFGSAMAQPPMAGAEAVDFQGQKVWAVKQGDGSYKPVSRKDGSLVPAGGAPAAPAAAAAPAPKPAEAAPPKPMAIPVLNNAGAQSPRDKALSSRDQYAQRQASQAKEKAASKEAQQKLSYAKAFRDIVKVGRFNREDRSVIEGAMNSGVLTADEERAADTMLGQLK